MSKLGCFFPIFSFSPSLRGRDAFLFSKVPCTRGSFFYLPLAIKLEPFILTCLLQGCHSFYLGMGSDFSCSRAKNKMTVLFFQCTRHREWKIHAFASMSSLHLWSLTPCLLFPAPVNYQKGTSEGNQALVLANA